MCVALFQPGLTVDFPCRTLGRSRIQVCNTGVCCVTLLLVRSEAAIVLLKIQSEVCFLPTPQAFRFPVEEGHQS